MHVIDQLVTLDYVNPIKFIDFPEMLPVRFKFNIFKLIALSIKFDLTDI